MDNTMSELDNAVADNQPAADDSAAPTAQEPPPPPTPSPEPDPETTPLGSGEEPPPSRRNRPSVLSLGGTRIGIILIAVVGFALILAALFLPPLSLLERLGVMGYTALTAETHRIDHADGLAISVDPATFDGNLRVRIDSVPRLDLLEGSAGGALRAAVEPEALPANLTVKSPYYEISTRGKTTHPVTIDVLVPNDAEPWQTLDLYTWDGEAWRFVGGELHTEEAGQEYLRAIVDEVPTSLVVMQAGPVAPAVSTYVEAGDGPITPIAGVVDEVNPTGLLLGTMGGFAGELVDPGAPGEGGAVVPSLRNWAPGADPNRGLLYDVLAMPKVQEDHIAGIVQSSADAGFAGIEIDYRGILPEDRDAYTAFIAALADGLHAQGLRLSIALTPVETSDGGWDEGSYDWGALGAVADAIRVRFPVDPAAYAVGGQAERLLDWVTARVSRYKVHMLVSSRSVELRGGELMPISLEEALAPLGQIAALQDVAGATTGDQLQFGLAGSVLSITPIESSGTYRLEYEDDAGATRTVWLGTSDSLAAKLQLAQSYHLGGVAIEDLLKPGIADGIVSTILNYRTAGVSPTGKGVPILWTVTGAGTTVDQTSTPLTEPTYSWMVLADEGTYDVSASIEGFGRGTVAVQIGQAAATVTGTLVTKPASEVTKTAGITDT